MLWIFSEWKLFCYNNGIVWYKFRRLMERKKAMKLSIFNEYGILEIMKELNNTFKIMKEKSIVHRHLKL